MNWKNVQIVPTFVDQGVSCYQLCLLYTSDAADEEDSVDLRGRRSNKKKQEKKTKKKNIK